MAFGMQQEEYERWIPQAPINSAYPNAYNFYLIESIEKLKEVLNNDAKCVAIDTETSGLDHDEAFMVGYSFCFDGVNAYYVPVNHATWYEELLTPITKEEYEEKINSLNSRIDNGEKELLSELDLYRYDDKEDVYYSVEKIPHNESLGDPAVELIYNYMLGKVVYMFNARFDIRVFEKYGFIENNIPMDERDRLQIYKYDLSRCNILDIQALIFDTDTNVSYPSLKKSEDYFLGWRGASFADTLGDAETFYNLRPIECYQYAATDALGTFLLANNKYVISLLNESYEHNLYKNAGLKCSAQLDTNFLYPLKMMEDEYTVIDVDRLREYSDYYTKKIEEVEEKIYKISGRVFNIASPKQKSDIFKELGITTIEYDGSPAYNARGELKADKEHINITIDKYKMSKDDPKRQLMEGTLEYATLTKQKGTYVDAFIKMATESKSPGKLRFGYKTMVVPSGRLAAGGDKKNHYTSETNIQNVPKPHMTMVYYVRYDDLIKVVPELEGKYDNPYEEYTYNGEYTYRILDWVFKETVWNLGIKEKKIEGFEQKLNMRSTFCADPDKYWVSCDFSAQELRLAALLSGEPGWTKTFANDGDLHEYMAKQIWDPSEYDKAKRKKAKKVNFGILYGMTARNFSNDFNIDLAEAQDLVDRYKNGAKRLFDWVEREENQVRTLGTVYTMFGRPRRLGWYLRPERSRNLQQFGLRSTANTIIQGSGGDILKMSFLNIYNLFFANPDTRNINRQYIKFINTVHDEINYNVSKKNIYKLVPMILSCMRMHFPDWQFPMKVGLAISSRWGTNIDFEYDDKKYIPIEEFKEKYPERSIGERYSQLPYEEQVKRNTFGPYSFYKDPNGLYVENPNFLGILEPAGEDVTEKDYEVKEEKKEEVVEVVEEVVDPNAPKLFDNLI